MKIKKIIGGFILVVVIGLLIAGGLNRTLAKTGGEFNLSNAEETRSGGGWPNSEISSLEVDKSTANQAQEQGGGRWAQENNSSQANTQPNSEVPGTNQADVQEWISVNGTVTEIDSVYLVITGEDGTLIEVGGRPWSYIQSQEFSLELGSTVSLQGFYETGDRFEIGVITNLNTGEDIAIRDLTGRPMWAGGGQRSGQNIDG
jgi:hypothetical protein